jgi:pimeloyl-ACP methyl ester carboxylesterase
MRRATASAFTGSVRATVSRSYFYHQVPALSSAGHQVIVWDQRGYGNSTLIQRSSSSARRRLLAGSPGCRY